MKQPMTLREWLWQWDDRYLSMDKKASQANGRSALRKIDKLIGDTPIESQQHMIRATQDLILELRKTELAPSSIRTTWTVLNRCLQQAVQDEVILAAPRRPKLPKRVLEPQDHFNGEQLRELAADNLSYAVAAETGARAGELLGLRTCDFDLTPGKEYLTIFESLYKGERQTPKTDSSVRVISISSRLAERLRSALADRPESGYLFRSVEDAEKPPCDVTELLRLHAAIKQRDMTIAPHGKKRCGFHAFRRGIITTGIKTLKISEALIAARVGHHAGGITLGVYFQFEKGADREAANLIGDYLFNENVREAGA